MTPLTQRTITSRRTLKAELTQVVRQGLRG